eukprot:scaffold402055_cov41-Prasinocladus_malaysianus.AAC.1
MHEHLLALRESPDSWGVEARGVGRAPVEAPAGARGAPAVGKHRVEVAKRPGRPFVQSRFLVCM